MCALLAPFAGPRLCNLRRSASAAAETSRAGEGATARTLMRAGATTFGRISEALIVSVALQLAEQARVHPGRAKRRAVYSLYWLTLTRHKRTTATSEACQLRTCSSCLL